MAEPANIADSLFRRYVATGDARTFGELFDATAGDLFEAALRLAHDAASAEDAVQETFVAALDLVDRFDTSRPVRPWLLGILRNKLREGRRSEARAARHAARAPGAAAAPDPLDEVAREDEHARVREHLDALPEPYREVAVLRWRYGLEPAEIADAIGKPPGTVRSLLHRSRERLRGALGLAVIVPVGVSCPGHLLAARTVVVRAAALQGAAIAAAAAASGVTVTTVLGVLAMKRLVVAIALLLALAVTGVLVWTDGPPTVPPTAHAPAAHDSARRHVAIGETTGPTPPADLSGVTPEASDRAIRGIVREIDGTPVADAEILVVGNLPDSRRAGGSATTRTGTDGTFTIEPPETAPRFRIVATSPRHAPYEREGVHPGADVTIQLVAGTTLRGRVVGSNGHPVPGARIEFVQAWRGAEFVRATTSDADGCYALGAVPARAEDAGASDAPFAYVHVAAEGWAPLTERLANHADLTRPLDIRLWRGARVEGVVLDAETERPVVDAEVVAWTSERRAAPASPDALRDRDRPAAEIGRTRSGPDGRFSFRNVPTGGRNPYASWGSGQRGPLLGGVAARADGYVVGGDEIPVPADGDVVDVRIALWRGAVVTGRVVDATGSPIPKARVSELTLARYAGLVAPGILGATRREVLTGANGRYRIEDVPAPSNTAAPARVWGRPPGATNVPGGVLVQVHPEVRAGETVEAPDIVLGSAHGVDPRATVRVTDASGTPVWGAGISWSNGGRAITTDRDGRAEFVFTHGTAGRPPTAQRLIVRAAGLAPGVTEAFVPSQDVPPHVDIALSPGIAVSGTVTWQDGSPAADASVTLATGSVPADELFPESGLPLGIAMPPGPKYPPLVIYGWATTDARGRFQVGDAPPGPYTLQASAGGGVATTVSPDGRDVRIGLPAAPPTVAPGDAVLEVVVSDTRDNAIPEAVVSVTGSTSRPLVPAPGTFRFEGMDAGTAQIAAGARGYRTSTAPATLVSGDVTRIELQLLDAAALRGRVHAGEGVDAGALRVSAFRVGSGPIPAAHTTARADGSYLLSGLGPGQYRIEVSRVQVGAPYYVLPEAVVVDLTEGAAKHVDLRAERGVVLQVRVPPAWTNDRGLTFRVTDGGSRVLARSAVFHRWDKTWVQAPTGEVVVELEGPDGPESRRVTVAVGEAAIVDFTVR